MVLKRWIRHGIDVAALAVGKLTSMQRRCAGSAVVLMYHRVLPDRQCHGLPFEKLVVAQSHFREQIRWIAENARHSPLIRAFDASASSDPKRPLVCVTFDDGYADNAEIAAPILDEFGVRATFYVTTGFVEGGSTWFDRAGMHWERDASGCAEAIRTTEPGANGVHRPATLDGFMTFMKRTDPVRRRDVLAILDAQDDLAVPLAAYRPMTVGQVRALHERGHEIGSHTRSHGILPQFSARELDEEIGGARETLRAWTGGEVLGFCYPNGDYDDAVIAAVRRAGHAQACTVERGIASPDDDPFRLRRRMISPTGASAPWGGASLLAFRAEAFGLHDALRAAY